MKAIIVGNSGSSLNSLSGDKIDKFETVIRTNCFEIEGYEKWVGSKVDIVSFGGESPAWGLSLKRNKFRPIQEIWLKHPCGPSRISKFEKIAPKECKVRKITHYDLVFNNFPVIEEAFHSNKVKNPSTAIRTCLEAISIHGAGNVYFHGLFGRNYYCSQKIVIDSEREVFWGSIIKKDPDKFNWYKQYDLDGIDYFSENVKGEALKKHINPSSCFELNHDFNAEEKAMKYLSKKGVFLEL
jgi:hypothetical protein